MADREATDHWFGHPGFADGGHAARNQGPSRFLLEVIYRDGVPRDVERYDSLQEALEARGRDRKLHLDQGNPPGSFTHRVIDCDDPERGALDCDDLQED